MAAVFLVGLLTATLSGCFSAFREPRSHAGAVQARAGVGEYQVVGGDTLYSIAFRHQLDFHDLAEWNRIRGPDYRIYPGRVLRLTQPGTQVASRSERAPVLTEPEPPSVTLPPDSAPPPLIAVAPPPTPTPRAPEMIQGSALGPRFDSGRWEWPTQGHVVRNFATDGSSKGIDIAGDAGQIVVAASAGKVVYSGSALKGYGELVIIKHDDQYLSAYGYNRRRLVKEGEIVGAGQPIAELGVGPEQKPELHFEIRDKGRPVDPLPLLPARS